MGKAGGDKANEANKARSKKEELDSRPASQSYGDGVTASGRGRLRGNDEKIGRNGEEVRELQKTNVELKKEIEELKQSFQLLEDKVKISLRPAQQSFEGGDRAGGPGRSASETELKPAPVIGVRGPAQVRSETEALAVLKASAQ